MFFVFFLFLFFFFFFKQKTAYEMLRSLVGSEMCIRDSHRRALQHEHRALRGRRRDGHHARAGGRQRAARLLAVGDGQEILGDPGAQEDRAQPPAGEPLRAICRRAGIPEDLLTVAHGEEAGSALPASCARVVSVAAPPAKGAMLVLEGAPVAVSYTHLRAHETPEHLVCRLLLEKKKTKQFHKKKKQKQKHKLNTNRITNKLH